MKTFIQRFGKNILGVLHGFDRIRLRGTRRVLAKVSGMMGYLCRRKVLLKDFKAFAAGLTEPLRVVTRFSSEGPHYSTGAQIKKLATDWPISPRKRQVRRQS